MVGVLCADSVVVDEVVVVTEDAAIGFVGKQLAALDTLSAFELNVQRVAARAGKAQVSGQIADITKGIGAFGYRFLGAGVFEGQSALIARLTEVNFVVTACASINFALFALIERIEAETKLAATANRCVGL